MPLDDILGGAGESSGGGAPTEIESWPKEPLKTLFTGYTREAFIQEAAISLFTAINWDGKSVSAEANNTYQRAVVLANVLGLK